MLARLARAALAFALLVAGQAALLHPLEHVDRHGHFVHLGGADGGDARGENERQDGPFNPSDKLGDSLAALTACVPDAPRVFAVANQVDLLPIRRQLVPRTAEAPPFLSQGPPALL